jgi:hypothetical protein
MAQSSRRIHWTYRVSAPALAFGLIITSLLMLGDDESPVRAATVTLTQVLSGLTRPIFVTHAGDGSGRLFVVEKAGVIKVLDGQLQSTPFLDITSRVKSDGGEEGLLGLAFHPSYESNGYFYVHYNLVGSSALTIARYQVTANRNVANPNSEVVILSIPHPTNQNHNGGMLAFGADGYLYAGIGDGGGSGDPPNNAQSLSVLLGKVLRIDVNGGSPYAIPPTNPFVNTPGARGEIWALGLRNPWRFAFDRLTQDLFLADVGQGSFEEIDRQPAGSPGGQNYQWRCMEGFHVFSSTTSCTVGTSTPPIFEYDHSAGNCSVTGGYVSRGPSAPSLAGKYLYGDFCSGQIWMLQPGGGAGWSSTVLMDTTHQISSFGEDEAGDVYVVAYGTSGAVYKFVDDDGDLGNRPDINRDGCISVVDFNLWLTAFKTGVVQPGTFPDVNNDGAVSVVDFNLWLTAFRNGEGSC